MHPLLRSQLAERGLSAESPPDPAQWREWLACVSGAYECADQDRRSEANFKALVESSPSGVFVQWADAPGPIVYANPAMARLLGYESAADVQGLDMLATVVHPEDRALVHDVRARREQGPTSSADTRMVCRDGSVRVVRGFNSAITFDGRPAWLCVVQDVTHEVRAQGELEASEESYRTLFEASPVSMMLFDRSSLRILQVNAAALRLYGYGREEFLTLTLPDLKVPEEVPELAVTLAGRATGTKWTGVRRHRRKDGVIIDISITSHAVTLDGREAMLAVGVDESQKKVLEDRLRQAQKMEAVGQLAGGIAHDFNNILAVILGDAELALDEIAPDHPAYAELKEIESAGRRAAMLTQQLLTFGRRQPSQPQVLTLDSVVTGLEPMLRRLLGEDIDMSVILAPGLGSVEADPGQMSQVLMNLAINARDAMPSGGRLMMYTRNVVLTEAEAASIGVPQGRYVSLTVADEGAGMDAATQARIFEPFFTTKEVGKGTGLGLSTVFAIVQQAGGGIAVSSAPGRGSTFRVYLPRVDQDCLPHSRSSGPPSPRGSERVLVVEDEESVRRVVARLLRSYGYGVVEATTGKQGLEIIEERGGAFDLVVTDLVMPGLDGRRMAERIRKGHPLTRVLFMSGYTEHTALHGASLGPGDHFLRKPFTMTEMGAAVRRALDARPPTTRPAATAEPGQRDCA
jgi:hypothetical protein